MLKKVLVVLVVNVVVLVIAIALKVFRLPFADNILILFFLCFIGSLIYLKVLLVYLLYVYLTKKN